MATWVEDVLARCRQFGTRPFHLDELYSLNDELGEAHPNNHNVEAKIRQSLQVLRSRGEVIFLGRGEYRLEKITA